ncbi:hypothetical protein B484DRAFT_338889 [Ochromonadaceae sp. CCMP2298]|nr:hypothetical protein B484DRAFT_338889 [Ochromonadaceae sp. CCMP2298]
MPWPFCSVCGTILDAPEGDTVQCSHCPFTCKFEEISGSEVMTHSVPTARPTWAVDDGEEDAAGGKELVTHATIEEPCPRCNHHELYFYTMQLRSVDEGSTVFYECPRCSYKYNMNN